MIFVLINKTHGLRWSLVVLHDVLEGAEEVLLEMEVGQLTLLHKLKEDKYKNVIKNNGIFLASEKRK